MTVSTASKENVCAGRPFKETCNAATLIKLGSITDVSQWVCMYVCMHDNYLFRPEPVGMSSHKTVSTIALLIPIALEINNSFL